MDKILICSATQFETAPLQDLINLDRNEGVYAWNEVSFHTTGVGILGSCFAFYKLIIDLKPDLIIQVGIAGSFHKNAPLGQSVLVGAESMGSSGVMESGEWKDIFDLKLANPDKTPFLKGVLTNPWLSQWQLPGLSVVNAITVDEISTDPKKIELLVHKYDCFLESMEGASLHYVALQFQIPFLQIRGISNMVGDRNKDNWKIKESIESSCYTTYEILKNLR